jgi:hypothetical protein
MKNFLALIGLIVVLVVGLGWYLGWYQLSTQPGSDGHRTINVDINTKKPLQDGQNLQKKISEAIGNNDQKGSNTIVPNVPNSEKKVEGQPTGGIRFNEDGSFTIIPPYKNVGQ